MLHKSIKVIAHRGLCCFFPENTYESIEAGMGSADLVEFDIMLTKDDEVVVMHDRYLSELTDVASKGQFKLRKASKDLQKKGELKEDWWVDDFTLQEIQSLRVLQSNPARPPLASLHFRIPTLDFVLRNIKHLKVKQPRNSGLLIQLKSYQAVGDHPRDQILIAKFISCLMEHQLHSNLRCEEARFPIVIQSFNHRMLKLIYESGIGLPLFHLYDKQDIVTKETLTREILPTSRGIAVTVEHMTENVCELCVRNKLQMYYWTVRDDSSQVPFGLQGWRQVYGHLVKMGVAGIITQFPERCGMYIRET